MSLWTVGSGQRTARFLTRSESLVLSRGHTGDSEGGEGQGSVREERDTRVIEERETEVHMRWYTVA